MHFAQPDHLHLLWALPLLAAFLLWNLRRRRKALERLISPALVPQLSEEFSRSKAFLRALLITGFFAFTVLALARPQWGVREQMVRRHGVDILVALDTSYSMNAEDVAPTRLMKAKSAVRTFIGELRGDRIGLVTFAGTAVVQCPLTLDYGAALLFADLANTETIPEPGTALANAIETAVGAFIAKETKYKVLILFTDGEDLEGEVEPAVQEARDAGVIIYAVGIGTEEGQPIPVRDQSGDIIEYRKDASGQIVLSRLDERALARIALETGGRYFRASTSERELGEIYDEISRMEKKELESKLFQNFEDQFQYPLALAILLLIGESWLVDRRKPGEGWLGRFAVRARA